MRVAVIPSVLAKDLEFPDNCLTAVDVDLITDASRAMA
jgi:hypothetical protein